MNGWRMDRWTDHIEDGCSAHAKHILSVLFSSVSQKLSANSRFVYCMQHNFLPFIITGKRKKTGPNIRRRTPARPVETRPPGRYSTPGETERWKMLNISLRRECFSPLCLAARRVNTSKTPASARRKNMREFKRN